MYFRLLGTNGLHIKAENETEIFSCGLALSAEPQTTSKKCTKKRGARAARFNIFPYSTNQSNHWFVALSLPFVSSSFHKLPIAFAGNS